MGRVVLESERSAKIELKSTCFAICHGASYFWNSAPSLLPSPSTFLQLDSHTSPYKRESPPFTPYNFHWIPSFQISSKFLRLTDWEEQCWERRTSKCTRNGKEEKQALNEPKSGLNLLTVSSTKYPSFTTYPEMDNLNILISWRFIFLPLMVCISEVCRISIAQANKRKLVFIWFQRFWFFFLLMFHSDVINRLNCLRGKGMASMYSWSAKRWINYFLFWFMLIDVFIRMELKWIC